jgi:hypothetical protein
VIQEYIKMKNSVQARPVLWWILIFLQILLGMGAVVSGAMLIAAPDGHLLQMPLNMLQYSLFPNFLIPGVILTTLLGIYPLGIAYSLWKRPACRWPDVINPFKRIHWSWAGSLAAGVITVTWIIVEVIVLRSVGFLHVLYFVWGIALVLLTLAPSVRRHYKID